MADDLAPHYRDPSQLVAERISDRWLHDLLPQRPRIGTGACADRRQRGHRAGLHGAQHRRAQRRRGGAVVRARPHASVVRPVRELKAFQRLVLAPGEAARVQFSVPVDMLQLTDHSGRRVVEPGWFDLMVGPSSACTPLMVLVEVVGAGSRVLPGLWRMDSCGEARGLCAFQCDFFHAEHSSSYPRKRVPIRPTELPVDEKRAVGMLQTAAKMD